MTLFGNGRHSNSWNHLSLLLPFKEGKFGAVWGLGGGNGKPHETCLKHHNKQLKHEVNDFAHVLCPFMQVSSCQSPPRGSRMARSSTSHTPTSPCAGGTRGVLRRESAVEVNDEGGRITRTRFLPPLSNMKPKSKSKVELSVSHLCFALF